MRGLKLPILYFDDLETYTKNSLYFSIYKDTSAYLCASVQVRLKYNKEKTQYESGQITNRFIFKEEKTLEDYFNFFLNHHNILKNKLGHHQIHYFHNGRSFDFYFLLQYLKKLDIIWLRKPFKKVKDYHSNFIYACMNWSQAYKSFTLFKKVNQKTLIRIEFRDTLYLFSGAIASFGEKLGYEKGDYFNDTLEAEHSFTVSQHAIEYCLRDSEILAKWFLRFVPYLPLGTLIPSTTSSWARQIYLNTLKTDDNKFNYFRELVGITKKQQFLINKAFTTFNIYKGGLSTFNGAYRFKTFNNIYVEDVVSQYPHKMTYDMPYGPPLFFDELPPNSDDYVIFMNVVYTNIKKRYDTPNYLSYSDSFTNYKADASTYSHFESFEFCEIFEKLHTFDKKEIKEIVAFKKTPSYFTDYVNEFINLKNHSEGAQRDWSKLMLNGLYGKLGENSTRTTQIFKELINDDDVVLGEYGGNNLDMVNVMEEYNTPFTFKHIASYITSLARAYLLERAYEIIKKGGSVLYHDTDSNFFIIDDPSKLTHGKNLGDWDMNIKKDFYLHGNILGSKKYILYDDVDTSLNGDGHFKIGSAGISQKVLKKQSIQHFINNEPYTVLNNEYTNSGLFLVETTKYLVNPNIFNFMEVIYKNGEWKSLYIKQDL